MPCACVSIGKEEAHAFSEVASARESYEVARKFLATLQLANAGNVLIQPPTSEEAGEHGEFGIKLLTTQRVRGSQQHVCMLAYATGAYRCMVWGLVCGGLGCLSPYFHR